LVELALKGNQDLFKEYSINDFDGNGYTAAKFSLSLSHPIPIKKYFDEFGVGLNVNYYYGIAVAEVISSEGAVVTTNDTILNTVDIVYRTGQGGGGIGFDIGAAGRINKKWTVSLALNNLFATLNWKNETFEHHIYPSQTGISIEEPDKSTEDPFKEDTLSTAPFKTSLPVVFHMGLAYDFLENLIFTLDLEQAFENKAGYSDRGQIAFGAQYKPLSILPLRAGMSFGGKYKYLFGVGFGVHAGFFNFDIAYAMHQGLWPTNIKFVF
jgi:long-subunit fatty acid transport protein